GAPLFYPISFSHKKVYTTAISDLGISGQPYAFIVNYLGFALPGVFILLAALSANNMWASFPAPRLGLRCMACAGGFLIAAGFYPFPSLIHLTSALLAGLSASISILGFSVYTVRHKGSSILAVSGFTIALLILTDAAAWVLAETRGIRIHAFMGIQQRIASFSAFIWFSAFAISSAQQVA
ncbi:MAG: DUF998 domain-containing protein, partial [Thermodesulfovibrionales bacterium]|nr:DUF998 domain-containing protein [Thermodesulfovibrionales bacterium]